MTFEAPTAFPLAWPKGWSRTSPLDRKAAPFFSTEVASLPSGASKRSPRDLTLVGARERLQRELYQLRVFADAVLSTNVALRLDGQPRSGMPEPSDPGAAVYFLLKNEPLALACDRWTTVAGNVAALAAHIKAIRAIERYGVGTVEQIFTGYLRLADPLVADDWRAELGNPKTLGEAEATYRDRMRRVHPDVGGSTAKAAALNAAIAAARKALPDA